MSKWAALGATLAISAWLIYPNGLGIKASADVNDNRVSALCRDATLSTSKTRSGTCSHRGGVERWIE